MLELGEVALLKGDRAAPEHQLELATRTNPNVVVAFFLLGYLSWKAGEPEVDAWLERALQARGEDWKPEGAVAEGDVASQMHREVTPLSDFWESWDGGLESAEVFADLDRHLTQFGR